MGWSVFRDDQCSGRTGFYLGKKIEDTAPVEISDAAAPIVI